LSRTFCSAGEKISPQFSTTCRGFCPKRVPFVKPISTRHLLPPKPDLIVNGKLHLCV
jgi:hypothetical protein